MGSKSFSKDTPRLFFISSNKNKLDEYRKFGLDMELKQGKDLKEVLGSPLEVIKYKSLEMGECSVVEDTSLEVEGADIGVEVKFLQDSLITLVNRPATVVVMLSLNYNGNLYIYEDRLEGKISRPKNFGDEEVFGFDNYFTPSGTRMNLHELKKLTYFTYISRYRIVQKVKSQQFKEIIEINSIPPWTGKYQGE